MSNVIPIFKNKKVIPSLVSDRFSGRTERIKEALDKINFFMLELKRIAEKDPLITIKKDK